MATPEQPAPALPRIEDLTVAQRRAIFGTIALVATDVDGTLTSRGEILAPVLAALAEMAAAGIEVVPVSGRPAGEVLGLVRYLPGVRRGIAENGIVEMTPDRPPVWLRARPDRERLREVARRLEAEHMTTLRTSADDPFRLGDVAFERDGREEPELERLRAAALPLGAHLIWSSVHIHLSPDPPDKGAAVLVMAEKHGVAPGNILTVGDAPNDAGLFVAGRFGATVGTADVLAQLRQFPTPPALVTREREAAGFLALADVLLSVRRRRDMVRSPQ
jgi:hydroxymethylpyrimidine pyrophosphatase-like HAD family hydrolase